MKTVGLTIVVFLSSPWFDDFAGLFYEKINPAPYSFSSLSGDCTFANYNVGVGGDGMEKIVKFFNGGHRLALLIAGV